MVAPGGWKPLEAYWPAREFLRDSERLIPQIEACYKDAHPNGRKPSVADVTSWRESVYALAAALDRLGLDQVWMFIEYRVAPGMNPIDVVLAGLHPAGGLSFAAVELKQWSLVEHPRAEVKAGLCASCHKNQPASPCKQCAIDKVHVAAYQSHKKHPAVQVHDNLVSLRTHHSMFDDRYVNLVGASYLHNLRDVDAQWVKNVSPRHGIETFTSRYPFELEKFLKRNFDASSGAQAAEALLERRRSGSLVQSEIGSIVNGHTHFSLVENQLAAVTRVMDAVLSPRPQGAKKVFVISGRAGSGKSLVALTLLGQALDAGRDGCYVSGGIASRETFKRGAKGRRSPDLAQISAHRGRGCG